MGMRRRTRRRALVAGAAIAHHETKKRYEGQMDAYQQGQQDAGGYDDQYEQPQYAPPPPPPPPPAPAAAAPAAGAGSDPTAELERLASLHENGVLTDDEFAAAKARILGI